MNIRDAYMICNPLASPPNLRTSPDEWPEDRSEDLYAEVQRIVGELTADVQGNNTVRFEEIGIEDKIDALVLAIVSKPVSIDTIEDVRKFRQAFFVAASKCAGRQIAKDIEQAREDYAVEQYELRQMERCEP